MPRGRTAYVVVRALRTVAVEPQSAPSLAETIDIGTRSARFTLVTLSSLGLIERVPDDPLRKRYRIAERGRTLGDLLLLAPQTAPRYDHPGPTRSTRERGHTVRTVTRTLEALAEEPRSSPQLARRLGSSERNARLITAAFARLRLIERLPDDSVLKRYRIAERGREFGARLVLARETVEPHRYSQLGPRNRRTIAPSGHA